MTTLSVVLTTYNGARYLRQQLDSLAAQTRRPDELVVADDQSTDGTWAIVRRFAETAPFPVRAVRNETRLGWRGNFMDALSRADGDVIALCDQDDVWLPEKLAVAEAALRDPDVVLFVHDVWLIDGAGARLGPGFPFPIARRNPPLSAHSMFAPPGHTMVLKRELLAFRDVWERSLDPNETAARAAHDVWFFFLASVLGTTVYSEQRLVEYRQHGSNAAGTITAARLPRTRKDWAYWLANPRAGYQHLARIARLRAEALEASEARLSGPWRERANEGARLCHRMGERFDRRAGIYGRGSVLDRAKRITGLYRDGVYADGSGWGFVGSALRKDLVLGLLLKPFLMEPASSGSDGVEPAAAKTA